MIAKTRFETKNEVSRALAGIGVDVEELRIEDFDLQGLIDLYNGLATIRMYHSQNDATRPNTKQ